MYIYICGDIDFLLGILVYRMLRSGRKKYLKWAHSGIMMLSFVLSVIALLAVFDSNHRFKPPVANLYTLHSWFGISTIALFAFQVYLEYLYRVSFFLVLSDLTYEILLIIFLAVVRRIYILSLSVSVGWFQGRLLANSCVFGTFDFYSSLHISSNRNHGGAFVEG